MSIIDLKYKNLYYIGGVVRDELLRINSFDIDITYEGNAIEFAKSIPNAEIIQINEAFGTVKINLNNKEIDIASTRCESYPKKGHLPIVNNIGCSLREDILRRDFTINALAKNTLSGEIIDYTGGIKDLKNKTLKILHDNSFIDDPTRIIRGLKFSIRFDFHLDTHTKKLQDEYLKNINYDMSYKRLKKELIETFNLNSPSAFKKFINEEIYKLISPHEYSLDINVQELSNLITEYKPNNIWLIYVGLLPDISNLPLTKIEKKIIEDFKNLKSKYFRNDFEIYQEFKTLNIETILMYSTINNAIVERYLNILQYIELEITGRDIEDLGITPSSEYRKCLDFVLEEKIKNPQLTKTEEIQLMKKFFNQ